MSRVRGVYHSGLGGEGADVNILSVSGDFPPGSQPGNITLEIDGPACHAAAPPVAPGTPATDLGILEGMFSPERARAITIGDDRGGVTRIENLYVSSFEPSEIRQRKASYTITLQDRRVWWQRRGAIGARAYNLEQSNERVNPFLVITGPNIPGNNPRMHAYSIRTAREILLEIMASLGENAADVKISGEEGFANLSAVKVGAAQISMLDDTPAWSQSDGEKPVVCLERFMALYGLNVAISPDSMSVGFFLESDVTEKIDDTANYLLGLHTAGVAADVAVGMDREDLPDVVMIHGAPIIISDLLTLEPVARDPDSPDTFIPLFLPATLEAYGVKLSTSARATIKPGAETYALAMTLATMEEIAPEIPPQLHSLVMEWGRLWRVAQPLETVSAPPDDGTGEVKQDPALTRSARVIQETDATTGVVYTRVRSPRYRLARDAARPGGFKQTAGGRTLWQPDTGGTTAEYRRWLPLLPHSAAGKSDGNYSLPHVYGCNLIRAVRVIGNMGQGSYRWVNFGAPRTPGVSTPALPREDGALSDLVSLGLDVAIVDPDQGVVDVGAQLIGNDGTNTLVTQLNRVPGTTPAALMSRYEVCVNTAAAAAEVSISFRDSGGGIVPGDPSISTPDAEQCIKPAMGLPYLVLRCATDKRSHGDARDYTSSHSDVPPHGAGDPFNAADNVLPGMRADLFGGSSVGALTPAPGQRGHPLEIVDIAIPDLELRCKSARIVNPNAPHSFVRAGGWDSGNLAGICNYMDVLLVTRQDCLGASVAGKFCPDKQTTYKAIIREISDAITRINAWLSKYRASTNNIKSCVAELFGCPRAIFPGTAAYSAHPVDAVSFMGSGDSATMTTRVGANAKGLRAFLGSASDRRNEELARARAAGLQTSMTMRMGI